MAPTFLWNGVERPETDVTFKEKKRRGDEDIGVQINDRFGKVVKDLGNQADLIKTYNRLFCANCVARLAVIYGVGVRSLSLFSSRILFLHISQHTHAHKK